MSAISKNIILGTGNVKKGLEVIDLLAPHGWSVQTLADFDTQPDIVEDADSFAGNAAIKAIETAKHYGCWAMGEDSGLRVDALAGAPGIYSARYSGPEATDEANNAKLIDALADVPVEKRGAGYVCSVAIANPSAEVVLAVEGTCRGRIGFEPSGTNGFGYDPYFVVREYHKTFGELPAVVKRKLSHRARAFAKLIPLLINVG